MLSLYIKVYIPSTVEVNKPAPAALLSEVRANVIRTLAGLFGGVTLQDGVGAWVSDAGEVVTENVTIATSFCESLDDTARSSVRTLAEYIKSTMGQEAVSVETREGLEFV